MHPPIEWMDHPMMEGPDVHGRWALDITAQDLALALAQLFALVPRLLEHADQFRTTGGDGG